MTLLLRAVDAMMSACGPESAAVTANSHRQITPGRSPACRGGADEGGGAALAFEAAATAMMMTSSIIVVGRVKFIC
jgi:hypothetical protein